MIRINKMNEAFVRVTSDDAGSLMDMNEHFSFYVDGYKFMPKFQMKQWDGKIRIFQAHRGILPYGLTVKAIEFAEKRNYEIDLSPEIVNDKIPRQEIIDFIDTLVLTSDKNEIITPRDYQINAIVHTIQNRRALILSPTGSGKSLIIYILTRWHLSHYDDRAIIVVPTTSLVEQMTKDFGDYSQRDDEFDPDIDVHKIYSGKDREGFKSSIVITTWQSIMRLPKDWFLQFGCAIGDEAHGFKAQSLNKIMGQLVNAHHRIGTTGTLDGLKCNELVLIGHFGPVYETITTKRLMKQDTLSQLKINCLVLNHDKALKKIVSKMTYAEEIAIITAHEGRNRFIANLTNTLKGTTLVMFNYVETHGKPLHALIEKTVTDKKRHVHYVSGEIDALQREEIRELTEKNDGTIIVASMGVFAQGINIKNLHNIIFAAPTKSQIKVLQSIGRGLRKAESGQECVVYDLTDDFSHYKRKNYTLKHGTARAKIYADQGFDFYIHQFPMPIR